MPMPWSQVAASQDYQDLSPSQREAARKQYFDQVVAPKVPKTDLDTARRQFDAQTAEKPNPIRDYNRRPADGMLTSFAKGTGTAASGVFELEKLAGKGLDAIGFKQTGKKLADQGQLAQDAIDAAMAPDRAAHPVASGAGQLVGATIGPGGAVGGLVRAGRPIAAAAAAGGLTGLLTPSSGKGSVVGEKAQQVATGAGLGAAVGAAAPLVARGITGAVQGVANWLNRNAPDAIHNQAVQRVMARFEHDEAGGGPSAAQAMATVNAANAAGKPMALVDVGGKNVQGLAGSVARAPGPSKAYIEKTVNDRSAQAASRLSQDVAQHLTSGPTMRQSAEALTAGQRAAAAPLYDRAFDTGSRQPLVPVLQRHIAEAAQKQSAAETTAAEARAALAAKGNTPPAKSTAPKVGPSLLEWIGKRGGVIDKGGDLRAMGADTWHVGKPGKRKLLAEDGSGAGASLPGIGKPGSGKRDDKGLDDVARAAWEAGYLPGSQRPDTNALLHAIGRELRGEKVHTAEDAELLRGRDEAGRYADFVEQHKETARIAAEAAGSRLTASEEHHAAELIAGGMHPDEAIRDAETASRHSRNIADEARSRKAYQETRLKTAQAEIEAARTVQAQAASVLQQAKADEAAGIKGGIWSPRVQQFLDDPIIKAGIGKGLEIQRLESLAEGKEFNPRDYAVTGADPQGNPMVGKVPNMRLLDAAKKGLDGILEGYRDKTTGRLVLDERGRAVDQVRRAFLQELDKLNPDYRAARAAWAGPADAKGALTAGRAVFQRHPEDIARIFGRLSPANKEQYRLGAADAIRDAIAKGGVTAAQVRGLAHTSHNSMVKEQLRVIFPSRERFERFLDAVTAERTMFERGNRVLGGSQTAERHEEDGSNRLGAAAHLGHAVHHAATNNYLGAFLAMARAKRDLGVRNNPELNMAMAKLLFSTSPHLDPKTLGGMNSLARAAQVLPETRNHLARTLIRAAPIAAVGATQGTIGQ